MAPHISGRDMRPAFIVAQYKCGTSWLLSALSAHPAVRGLREIDIVRAAWDTRGGGEATPASPEHRLEHFFGTSAWCNRNQFGDDLLAALESGEHPQPDGSSPNRPQGFADLGPNAAVGLYRAVRDAASPSHALDAFVAATSAGAPEGTDMLVLKAADQIAVFGLLQAWQPAAPKMVITRDGRDAAISASHYKQLMQDAPWYSGDADYWRLLENWATRARMIADRARAGEVEVIRYEDLSADFAGTFTPLLEWLGLDSSPALVERIEAKTSFEARTGRERGTEGKGVIRKGMVGEWRETLTDEDKGEAWKRAGEELAALGYTEDGPEDPLPEGLTRL